MKYNVMYANSKNNSETEDFNDQRDLYNHDSNLNIIPSTQ